MSKYVLQLKSKDKNSINNFLKFIVNNYYQHTLIYITLLKQKKITEKISVLKSPHVNKTAQEHYNFSNFCVNFLFCHIETKKELFVLKKISNQLFPTLKLAIKKIYSKKQNFLCRRKKIFYCLQVFKLKQKNMLLLKYKFIKKAISYLKFLDYKGQIS